MPINPLYLLWSKIYEDEERKNHFYPLPYHMIDSYNVSLLLWDGFLHSSIKDQIAEEFGSLNECKKFLSFLVYLHDIGKCYPDFQGQGQDIRFEKIREILKSIGFNFPRFALGYHNNLSRNYIWKKNEALAFVLAGHHGFFSPFEDYKYNTINWNNVRDEIYQLGIALSEIDEKLWRKEYSDKFLMFLSGYIVLCDWISSGPYQKTDREIDFFEFQKQSYIHFERVLPLLGFKRFKAPAPIKTISEFMNIILPGGKTKPRPLQEIAENIESNFSIIEGPMGEGKTEAGLRVIDKWITENKISGFYFGLPTMATSNQMFERILRYFRLRGYSDVNYHLINGQSILNEQYEQLTKNIGFSKDEQEGQITAESWFRPHKLALIAPFGVGTIDQPMLGAIQSKHFFLRLFALIGKALVIDEVHAYDTYMDTIIERLLQWCGFLGIKVLLLSATLPKYKRDALYQAYYGEKINFVEKEYPRITTYNSSITFDIREQKRVQVQWTYEEKLSSDILESIQNGGNVVCIRNTVKKAQRLYSELISSGQCKNVCVYLLHSHFIAKDRRDIEEQIKKLYGRGNENRPFKSIVISTQIVEQSMDLDFDVMFSDLCPIDLIFQRVGRLHRHKEHDEYRPQNLKIPVLWVNLGVENIEQNTSTKDLYEYDCLIYDKLILDKSLEKMKSLNSIHPARDIEECIEFVYTQEVFDNKKTRDKKEAGLMSIISSPNSEFYKQKSIGFDDNDIMVKTRLTIPTLPVIFNIDSIDLSQEDNTVKKAMDYSCHISQKDFILFAMENNLKPEYWEKLPILKFYFHILGRELRFSGYCMRYDKQLGIIIDKEM